MRNKFSELVKQGIASFNYTPISHDTPEQDPICRMYNNIYSIPSDTHMSCLDDGSRVITGHMINTPQWSVFCRSCAWAAVDFRTSGCWSLCDFLYKHGLKGEISTLNGDVVYKVIPFTPDEKEEVKSSCSCPMTCNTLESRIPIPITSLTNSGNKLHLLECFNNPIEKVVEKMNESVWIKGNNWVPFENNIVGLIGDQIYILEV